MRRVIPFLLLCGFIFLLYEPGAPATGQQPKKKEKGKFDPPDAFVPTPALLQQIEAKTAQLAAKIAELRKDKKHAALLPDVEIYLRGAENIVRFKEWYNKDSSKWTLDALDRGLQRAEQLAKGETPWTQLKTRNVARGYRSAIDGTAQLYGVTYPLEYGKDPNRKWRVDVVLHGRDGSLTEVKYLNSNNGSKKVSPDQDWVQLDMFGRGNNAYRWSGETDVMEAMEAFFVGESSERRYHLPDRRKIVLRGFSMGGAGTWHLGLHHPDKWCVMGPGAGFTTTHGYAGGLPNPLPDYQEKCLRIYDAIDYVENARMIPIVAYSGGDDPQKKAADNIEDRLKELKINAMTHLVKPGEGHKFPADWFTKANALWSESAAKGHTDYPKTVSFTTYTTKFPGCDWVTIYGLESQYRKASVNAEKTDSGFRVVTANVRVLVLALPDASDDVISVDIDGQQIKTSPDKVDRRVGNYFKERSHAILIREGEKWRDTTLDALHEAMKVKAQKTFRLQGPIDDAFSAAFLCVLGSGDTFHPATQKFVDAKVKAFKYDWAKHWRGELPTTGDYAVTPNDIKDKHLVLFGDPSSNLTLAQILPKLPIKWTKDEIEFDGKKYKSSEHVPVMIFPNPLNPQKYVVLNTGHTIPSEDYAKTNAMLFPRLGDYAILRMTPTAKNAAAYEVETAGLFDEFWRVEKK